jgi:hypothetical protein
MRRLRMHQVMPLVMVIVVLAFSPVNTVAQSVYGKMAGTVTDASGAVVAAATVTLTNLATSEKRSMQSDATGSYTFVNILPNRYRLEAQKEGFKLFRRDPIVVEIESGLRVDISLQVGSAGEVIDVTAETPLLQPETTSLGGVVESRSVSELPLNGRNPLGFVGLEPGVVPQGNPSQGNSSGGSPVGANIFALGDFQIGGGQAGQSAILIDGVATNGAYLNVVTVIPTQDAIQEFKVQTNNLGPEYGRFAGGVINLSTKSGTNSFHGSVYEFLRNKVLNSNDYFSQLNKIPKGAYTQNQFGANLGGRIIKDKLFFFSSYEGYRLRKGSTFTGTVPTLLERTGNFSDYGLPIYDPLTSIVQGPGPTNPAACGSTAGPCRTAFAGNIIPANRLDPSAVALLKYFPLPTGSGTVNNFAEHFSTGGNISEINERLDYNISDTQRLFGRYTWWKNLSLADSPFNGVCTDRCTENINSKQAALGYTLMLTPKTVLDLHLGYTRFVFTRVPLSQGIDLSQFGPNWTALSKQFSYTHLPEACIAQTPGDGQWGGGWCGGGTGSGIGAYDDILSFTPSLSKIIGAHTLKIGGELRILRNNYFQTNNPAGEYGFDAGMTTANPFQKPGIASGVGFASFELGYGTNSGSSVVTPSRMATELIYKAFYVGDTFQATKRLTLNLGARVDLQGDWTERYNRILDFLPNATSPLASSSLINPATGQSFANLQGAFGLVASPQRSSRSALNPWNSVSPRFGLSYQLDSKTVIRSGYGMFYLPVDIRWNDAPHNLFINSFTQPWLATLNSGQTPNNVFSNPFPTGIIQPPGRSQAFMNVQGSGLSGPISNNPSPYVQQWNFNIQRELPGNTLIDVAYAGSKGTHLPQHSQDLNQLPAADLPGGSAGYTAAQLTSQVANPFNGIVQSGSLAGSPTTTFAHMLYPYPQYDDVAYAEPDNRDSIYHSMQLKVQKRFAGGAQVLAAYTVAKLIDNTNNEINWLGDAAPQWGDSNAYNIRAERSLDGFDVPQRLVVSSVLDLPFGRGKKFAGDAGKLTNAVIGGWGVDTIITFQSGYPLSMGCGAGLLNSIPNAGCPRATRTGTPHLTSGPIDARLKQWFTTSNFSFTNNYSYGNDSRTEPNIRAQGEKNFDFALFKEAKLSEKFSGQFRVEFFNLFNRTQFSAPNTSVGSGSFGQVTSQYNLPRVIQVAARVNF